MFSKGSSLGSVDLLPPIVTAQFHFAPNGDVRPYLGAGFNVNRFSHASGKLNDLRASLATKVGWVAQGGVDFMLNKSLSLGADLKYLQVKPDVTTSAANDVLDLKATIVGVGLGYRF